MIYLYPNRKEEMVPMMMIEKGLFPESSFLHIISRSKEADNLVMVLCNPDTTLRLTQMPLTQLKNEGRSQGEVI